MEALSGSASLDDFVSKIEATDWAGCDARAFARAATVKLVTLSKAEKYRNDTDGEKARVASIYDQAKRASSRAAPREEWIKVAELLGLTPSEVRDSGKPESLPATVSPNFQCDGQSAEFGLTMAIRPTVDFKSAGWD